MPCASDTVLTQPDWKTSILFFSFRSDVNPTLRNASEENPNCLRSRLPGPDFPKTGNSRVSLASSRLNRPSYSYGLGHVVWHPPPSDQDLPVTRHSVQVVTRLGIATQSELSKEQLPRCGAGVGYGLGVGVDRGVSDAVAVGVAVTLAVTVAVAVAVAVGVALTVTVAVGVGVAVPVAVGVAVVVGVGVGVPQLPTDSTVVDAAPPEPPPATKPRVLYRAVAEPPSCETSSDGPVRQLLLPGL